MVNCVDLQFFFSRTKSKHNKTVMNEGHRHRRFGSLCLRIKIVVFQCGSHSRFQQDKQLFVFVVVAALKCRLLNSANVDLKMTWDSFNFYFVEVRSSSENLFCFA